MQTQERLYHPMKKAGPQRGHQQSHLGQAKRSQRKRTLKNQRREADAATAIALGIGVEDLKLRRFNMAKHFLRDDKITTVKTAVLPEAKISGWQDGAYCPYRDCSKLNYSCMTGTNTCQRCGRQFIGKH